MEKIIKFVGKLLNIRIFSVFCIFIFAAKVTYSFITGFPGGVFEDWQIAVNLAQHGVYAQYMDVGPTAYKLPVYPVFISFFVKFFPEYAREATVLAQHLLFFVCPFLLIKIFSLFGKQKAGILAGYMLIFSPAYFYYSNVLEITNVFVPVFLFWIYQYLRIFTANVIHRKDLIVLAVVTGVLFLTQVIVVPLVGILLMTLFILKKIRFSGLVLLIAVGALVYSPWIIRNYVVFDKIILTKTPFWQNIYFSFVPGVNVCPEVMLISNEHERYTFQLKKSISEFEMEKVYQAEVQRVLDGNEEVYIKKALQNAVLLWYVPSRYFHDPLTAVFGRKLYVLLINVLTLWALSGLYRSYRRLFWVSLLLFAGFTAPYMIGHAANMRFKLDFEWVQYALISLFIYERFIKQRIESPRS